MSFSWVDWSIIAIITISTLMSFQRGFFREGLSLLIWLFAIVLSLLLQPNMSVLLEHSIHSPSLRKIAALVILFVLCLLAGGVVSWLLGHLIKATGLSGTDKVLGLVFGALRGVLIVVVLLIIGDWVLPLHEEHWWRHSVLIPHFLRLESWTIHMANALRDFVLPLLKH